ncbi:MAG TPA: GNAT family N-acetyltransferase [Anaerolineales bacterium]|nr:GNAT family N-acetyltransferase [Anaerolineales bacterium]HNQ96068.1 GNAT family N-acetyltransferase [Anaerolineales bacterium]HNS61019.1 GNAT family N-acetyltransferase [Anaerolineales bacterium]
MATDDILHNATDEQLGLAVFENLYDLFRAMANHLPDGKLIENGKLSRHLTFPTNPMFKGVWNTRLSEHEADTVIDETIAWFKEQNAPFFFWWTGGITTPDDLEERLAKRGMISMAEQTQELAKGILSTEQGSPCMVAELSKMNESVLAKTPAGFVIKEAEKESHLYDFKKVFVETYAIPEWAGQAWVDATLKIGIGKTQWRIFVGYLNDNPVATNMLFNGAGVASVYAVATLPSTQGKGIGAAITLKPLLDARDKEGYKYAVLFSTEMGVKVYQRIGFRLTNLRINRFLWRNG